MRNSTQAYLIRDGRWLMLLRNKKANDINEGKWIGIGGKQEPGETIRECMIREIREETGLDVTHLDYRGILYFFYENNDSEKIWVYTSEDFRGEPQECNEGTLAWIEEEKIKDLSLWEGDRLFLKRMIEGNREPFCLYLYYDADGVLTSYEEKEAEHE